MFTLRLKYLNSQEFEERYDLYNFKALKNVLTNGVLYRFLLLLQLPPQLKEEEKILPCFENLEIKNFVNMLVVARKTSGEIKI
uniref:Uncharacterized protein n=1 Tax=candidate division WOR-3 bacterium TaxID=2052148 RepID=A0A7V4E4U4_UNCW3